MNAIRNIIIHRANVVHSFLVQLPSDMLYSYSSTQSDHMGGGGGRRDRVCNTSVEWCQLNYKCAVYKVEVDQMRGA